MPIATMTMTLMERVNLSHPIGIVQKLIESRVRFRQTDKEIVKVVLKSLLTHRLTTIEVIPQKSNAKRVKEFLMSVEPTFCRRYAPVLFLMTILRSNKFRVKTNYRFLLRRDNYG
jgi:hypothetical protein